MAGIVALLALALVVDALIVVAGRLATPWERPGRRRSPALSPAVGGAR